MRHKNSPISLRDGQEPVLCYIRHQLFNLERGCHGKEVNQLGGQVFGGGSFGQAIIENMLFRDCIKARKTFLNKMFD